MSDDTEAQRSRAHVQSRFSRQYPILWTNLSRLNGSLLLANVSLFFLTRLVVDKGYYYPFYWGLSI